MSRSSILLEGGAYNAIYDLRHDPVSKDLVQLSQRQLLLFFVGGVGGRGTKMGSIGHFPSSRNMLVRLLTLELEGQ